MSKIFALALAALGLSALQAMITVPVAQAAIVCKDGFQKSGGNWISTPYCNDADLARIAREHGVKVSADEVRNIIRLVRTTLEENDGTAQSTLAKARAAVDNIG